MTDITKSVEEFITLLNLKVRLSDFIGQFVNLQERGNSFIGRCPFHNDKTPSFNVNNEKGLYYCFGCKAGGNIITFVKDYKNMNFNESLKYLSEYSGIKLQSNLTVKKYVNQDSELIKILEICKDFFLECLSENYQAKNYVYKRVSEKMVKKFEIGFCPDHKILGSYLQKKGYSPSDYNKLDLFIKNKKGEIFGRFSNRIIFPIFDFERKIVGFGGRTINNSKIKYINSQESIIFKKSNILFGLKQNLDFIKRLKEIFLVEGYLDVIKLSEFDIRTAVSSLGTTLSESQLKKMWHLVDTPLICFDGDNAGINASKNIAIKCLQHLVPGKSLKFIFLNENIDPDQFVTTRGKDEFLKLKTSSVNLSDLIWSIILDDMSELTPEFVATLDQKIKYYVSKISNEVVAKEYFRFLKGKKDKFLWDKNSFQTARNNLSSQPKIVENLNEKIFITILIFEKKMFTTFYEEIINLKLKDQDLEEKKNKIIEFYSGNDLKTNTEEQQPKTIFSSEFQDEINGLRFTHLDKVDKEDKKVFFLNIINNIRLPSLIEEREEIKQELLSVNEESSKSLLMRFNNLNKEIKNIQNKKID